MTGAELRALRKRLGYSQAKFGRLAGLKGLKDNVRRVVARYEQRLDEVPIRFDELLRRIKAEERIGRPPEEWEQQP
jgi:transcriptional regulator with XRE-family HTH domain